MLNISLNRYTFGGLVGLGIILVGTYIIRYIHHLVTRIRPDEYYITHLLGTEYEVNGKVPPYGAFPLVEFPNIIYVSIALVTISYTLVLFCGIAIYFKLKKTHSMLSDGANRYQRQITIVMTAEVCVIQIIFGEKI
uniref:Uncharacterized protein n=1 Tax=Panagrolaimus sp. PS1159 TaxID=55785 RepID=A0AC35GRE6_9BILA